MLQNLRKWSIGLLMLPLVAQAAPATKPFRWPNPSTDCEQFKEGPIAQYSRLTALSKVPQEQLSRNIIPKNLVEIPAEVLNPNAIKWAAQAAAKTPPESTLYKYLAEQETLQAFLKMAARARSEGYRLYIYSGYRSYVDQCYVYSEKLRDVQYKATSDQELQEMTELVFLTSAYPGRSEHQLGTALDITSESNGLLVNKEFEITAEFQWLEKNAHLYGFAMSYPQHDGLFNQTTGYVYEPWHWRYIGPRYAQQFKKIHEKQGITLVEYLRQLNKPTKKNK